MAAELSLCPSRGPLLSGGGGCQPGDGVEGGAVTCGATAAVCLGDS